MASTEQELRRELSEEREQLADAVESLREATNVGAILRSNLGPAAVGALGAGFVVAGGLGATVRLLFRRESDEKPRRRVWIIERR
jgi:hypothetical protein